MTQQWTAQEVDAATAQGLADACGLAPLVARVLVARGITTPNEAAAFLYPDLGHDWSDATLIPGMAEVVNALEAAMRANKRILVFGDYDVDGISATACLLKGLAALGTTADYLIPNRADEGYGLSPAVLERVYERDPELLITVDCGIASRDEVAELVARGIEVLITDHHEPSDAVPCGVPVADPKLVQDSPQAILAGVGVALKLLTLLGERFGKPQLWRSLTDLATLGTLADVMPLTGENRSLVTDGLALIERVPRPGVAAVLARTRHNGGPLSARDLTFGLIPRLNAAGRMDSPTTALELLISDDPSASFELAEALEAANNNRRAIESTQFEEALAQVTASYHGQKVVVAAGEGWHEGVRGIVAARLVSRFGVPALVFTLVDGEARGSGRSVGAVNLFKAVESCASLTLRFGGHEAAVGVTLDSARLAAFTEQLEAVLAAEPEEHFHPPLVVDAQPRFSELSLEAVEQLASLDPYGQGNREPLFATRGVLIKAARAVGVKKNHLSFVASDSTGSLSAIWFQCPNIEDFLTGGSDFDLICRPQVDEWNGRRRVKLMVEQVYPRSAIAQDPQELAAALLGRPAALHSAQRAALDALQSGASALVVMATGRGKSLIFQTHAARLALTEHRTSVFIYPLRALIADQAAHLAHGFARLGLVSRALTGEDSTADKDRVFQDLYEGKVDALLTTPEFFGLHAWRFAESGRVGFIVFDEAHHIQTERATGRGAYRDLSEIRARFPQAQFLALTATSDDRVTSGIREALSIERIIVDNARRDNLLIDDARDRCDRDAYLLTLMDKATKSLVYVNSRIKAMELVHLLRKHSAQPASVVFYHAGLTREKRSAIEEGFRSGELTTIVSTSAFGEGVNIPDVSDVVLYHLPLSAVAFNQMAGRAGRDGQPATIHLLYTAADAELNRGLLASLAPTQEELTALYKALRTYARAGGGAAPFTVGVSQLVMDCLHEQADCGLDERGIATGVAIFAELGLLRLIQLDGDSSVTPEPRDLCWTLEMTVDARVELSASSIYLEGREEFALSECFSAWALEATAEELCAQMRGPLTPSHGDTTDG
ncbi:MAG: single-stranded-DNA-specific exonuclease RecJ [Coriobacteriales bacterium]|jgi:single-stranded-DNA-specific exonuclease|nr:single-stranded-DNA-specific exonuclease RecJ [Coriobacteriales bacterium]